MSKLTTFDPIFQLPHSAMTASGATPPLQAKRILRRFLTSRKEETAEQQVTQASKTWFSRSPLFYSNFTSDDFIKEEEFSQFAKMFKQERVRMGFSAKKVAIDLRCSSTTIHRFEAIRLSLWSMRKWKPRLQNWLELAAKSSQVERLAFNRVLETYMAPWRPWSPGNRHGQGAQQR